MSGTTWVPFGFQVKRRRACAGATSRAQDSDRVPALVAAVYGTDYLHLETVISHDFPNVEIPNVANSGVEGRRDFGAQDLVFAMNQSLDAR